MTPPLSPRPSVPFHADPALFAIEVVFCAEDGAPQRRETRALQQYFVPVAGDGRTTGLSAP